MDVMRETLEEIEAQMTDATSVEPDNPVFKILWRQQVRIRDLCREALAARPADDDEQVTIASLRAAGFVDFTGPDKYCEAYLSFWLDRREHNVAILGVHWARPDSRDGPYWSANGFTLYKGAHPKTMGDVRRLIRALAGASVG